MKKYLSGLLAILLAVGFSSFDTRPSEDSTVSWFKLKAGGNPSLAADYILDDGIPCDDPNGNICGVYAEADVLQPTRPDFSLAHDFTFKQ